MPSRGVGKFVYLSVVFGGAGFFLNRAQVWAPSLAPGLELQLAEITAAPATARKERVRRLPLDAQNTPRKLPSGEVHRYGFQLRAGQILETAVEQDPVRGQEIDVAVRLYSPSGELLYEIDNPTNATRNERVFLLAKSSGEHNLEVASRGEGIYRLGHIAIHKASEKD